jgi:transcriptional regulator with XRE-family HTH domain
MTTLGSRVKKARETKGLKQHDLADRAGVSVGFLSEIENNHRNPSGKVLLKIASVLGTTMDYLQTGHSAPTPARERNVVSIPPALADAAEQAGLSYAATAALAEAYQQIVARRGGKEEPPTAEEWLRIYQVLRRHLGE